MTTPQTTPDIESKTAPTPTAPFNIIVKLAAMTSLLTVEEVADLLAMSKFTIYRMAGKRRIPSIVIGGCRRFDPSTLIVWLTKKEPQLAVAARQLGLAL